MNVGMLNPLLTASRDFLDLKNLQEDSALDVQSLLLLSLEELFLQWKVVDAGMPVALEWSNEVCIQHTHSLHIIFADLILESPDKGFRIPCVAILRSQIRMINQPKGMKKYACLTSSRHIHH